MGIGKLIISGPREVVSHRDDALDKDAEGFKAAWEEYDRTLDLALLRPFFKPGAEPAVFIIEPLTLAQQKHVANQTKFSEGFFECLAYGVREFRGVEIIDEHGKPVEVKRVKGDLGQRLPDVALELFKDDNLRVEIWARVRQVTGLSPEARKSDPA